MSYTANNENMAKRFGIMQRDNDANVNVRFRLPAQTRAITNTHGTGASRALTNQDYTNSNHPANTLRTPMDLSRMAPVAGPSRNQSTSYDVRFNTSFNDNKPMDPRRNFIDMNVQETTSSTVPRLLPISSDSASTKKPGEQNSDTEHNTASNFNFRVYGSSESEKMFIFTGTVERVIKWNKIFRNHFCYFEVIAGVLSIQEGSIKSQRIMLLRDRKGPILQVVYYVTTHMDIEDFHVGQILRCIGKMSATNLLNAMSIRSASQEEIDILQRLSLICDHAVSHFLNA